MKQLGAAALLGAAFGAVLTLTGFDDFSEVHAMFVLRDPRLWLTFAGAVALSALGFAVIARKAPLPRRRVQRATVAGAVIFGAGWAITGACPGVALVQIAHGYLPAIATLAGIVAGIFASAWARRRLALPNDSC